MAREGNLPHFAKFVGSEWIWRPLLSSVFFRTATSFRIYSSCLHLYLSCYQQLQDDFLSKILVCRPGHETSLFKTL